MLNKKELTKIADEAIRLNKFLLQIIDNAKIIKDINYLSIKHNDLVYRFSLKDIKN